MTLWSAICRSIGLSHLAPYSNWLNPEAYPAWPRDTVRQVDIVTGCFFLIRRRFWDALGGFDPAFFVYGEEVDLCLRARQFEAQPIIVPEATVFITPALRSPTARTRSSRYFRHASAMSAYTFRVGKDASRWTSHEQAR